MASIIDVENALNMLKAAAAADSSVEAKASKKLDSAVELIVPKDGITKDLNQAFNHGESWWAKNVLNGQLEGCTADNKFDKIKLYVTQSSSFMRHTSDPSSKAKVERWLADKFPIPVNGSAEESQEDAA